MTGKVKNKGGRPPDEDDPRIWNVGGMGQMKLGSLFDGSGGFPLAASMCGIDPIWASEIEPYPIAVTTSRFPKMKHLGDVSKINGAELEPVDVITFGSPCQDLSVAGKRAGMKHEDNGDEETTRSGLFLDAIRIIKEMREATNGIYPRFAVWENVFGAFSSNKGEDFRKVLEEFVKIKEPTAEMSEIPKGGWAYADIIVGDGWSIAYRTVDAQYWGVPQRRRRIYLVADFASERIGEILFKREGLRGYFAEGRTPWQGIAEDAQGCTGADDREGESIVNGRLEAIGADIYNLALTGAVVSSLTAEGSNSTGTSPKVLVPIGVDLYNQAEIGDKAMSIRCRGDNEHTPCVVYAIENYPQDSRVNIDESGKCQCLTNGMGTGGGKGALVQGGESAGDGRLDAIGADIYNLALTGAVVSSLTAEGSNSTGTSPKVLVPIAVDRPAVAYACSSKQQSLAVSENLGNTLGANDYKEPQAVAYGFYPQMKAESIVWSEEKANCLCNGTNPGFHNGVCITEPQYIVRRLTPTECARLQGFPDNWGHPAKKTELTDEEYAFWLDVRKTDAEINGKQVKEWTNPQILTWYNKLHTDSAEYKMWGNGIALPNALYVMQGIAEEWNNIN